MVSGGPNGWLCLKLPIPSMSEKGRDATGVKRHQPIYYLGSLVDQQGK